VNGHHDFLRSRFAALEISAGFRAGRHNHPGVVMAQIVEGEFRLQRDGQPEQALRAGESFTLPDRAVHNEGSMGCVRR